MLSVYERPPLERIRQSEVHLYGSSRLGVTGELTTAPTTVTLDGGYGTAQLSTFTRGEKFFELSNHLGNVLATITDKKLQHPDGSGGIDYYVADIATANDYYPFGMLMPGRKYAADDLYRYGFNGQERSTEIDPNGNSMTAEFWQYDARIGRRWNVDPVEKEYESPYAAFGNNPIWNIDSDGADTSKYLSNSQLLEAVKLAREKARSVMQSNGNYHDTKYQDELIEAANTITYKNKYSFSEAKEFREQVLAYFTNYYYLVIWPNGRKALSVSNEKEFESKDMTDGQHITAQIYTIGLYEKSTRNLKGALMDYANVLMYYAAPVSKLGKGSISSVGRGRTLSNVTVTATKTTGLRKVGSFLESVDDVMVNPRLLEGQSYTYVRNMLGKTKGWVNSVMTKTRGTDKGWVLRQVNSRGVETGKLIQYHPGSRRHFSGAPYWKVSDGANTFRYPAFQTGN